MKKSNAYQIGKCLSCAAHVHFSSLPQVTWILSKLVTCADVAPRSTFDPPPGHTPQRAIRDSSTRNAACTCTGRRERAPEEAFLSINTHSTTVHLRSEHYKERDNENNSAQRRYSVLQCHFRVSVEDKVLSCSVNKITPSHAQIGLVLVLKTDDHADERQQEEHNEHDSGDVKVFVDACNARVQPAVRLAKESCISSSSNLLNAP